MINKENTLYQLLKEYLFEELGINKELHKILVDYKAHPQELLFISKRIKNGEEILCKRTQIRFTQTNDTIQMKKNDLNVSLSANDFFKSVQIFYDMMMPIYPLGTIVTLKQEYLSKMLNGQKIAKAEFVVIQRFSSMNGIATYLPLGGVVYPLGMMGSDNILYFTPELVESVVYPGYSDESEIEFEILMKKELVLEKGVPSILFADGQTKHALEQRMKGE